MTLNNGIIIDDNYDSLSRLTQRSLGLTTPIVTTYSYAPGANGSQTGLVSQMQNGSLGTYGYTYDANGNIQTVTNDGATTTYHYDSANQLIREDNQSQNRTTTYTYDGAGNILSVKEYAYTTGSLDGLTATGSYTYTYGDSVWKDMLTSYNGSAITYDASGNPTNYLGNTLTWEGRQLATYGSNISF